MSGSLSSASIRGRLVALAFLAAIPIAGMAGIIAWQNYQATARGSRERATLLDGQALAQFQEYHVVAARGLALAGRHMSAGACAPEPQAPGTTLVLFDGAGRAVCVSGEERVAISGRPDWLQRAEAGLPVMASRVGPDDPRVVIAIPSSEGGVLARIVPPARFAEGALPPLSQPGDAIWLLDENRQVVASIGDAAEALPTLATMATLIAAPQRSRRSLSATDRRYAYATTALPGGWRLVTATPAWREAQAGRQALLVQLAELFALLVIGFAAVVAGADVAFGQPLRRLSDAVRRWQGGGRFHPGDLTGAPLELRQLARSFEDAIAVLGQRGAELERAKEKQDLLIMEVHHRVKNNLQVIASLLNLQSSRIRLPEARAEFQAARDRIRALATLHRHLYADGELHTINMRSFLNELCGQLLQAMGEKQDGRVKVVIDAPELRLSSDQAVPLALIVTEAVTNSVRYAFPGGRPGRIEVSLTERGGALDLLISDDGVGIQHAQSSETGIGRRDGIGLQLMRGFARQLGATLSVMEGPGTRYDVRIAPAAAPQPHPVRARLDAAAAGPDDGA